MRWLHDEKTNMGCIYQLSRNEWRKARTKLQNFLLQLGAVSIFSLSFISLQMGLPRPEMALVWPEMGEKLSELSTIVPRAI